MRIIIVALACALLGGCGAPVAGYLDAQAAARLREALSEQPRLPDGFSARPDPAWQLPFASVDHDCRAALAPAGGRAPAGELMAQAAASYEG
ncbi:hypothetical protein, partial [Nonomuraea rhizosphaerae]|uniref:hypothetical protein n=1 Tax=Nonomuraea rhizosphaerae TaxID=2665663 RepID=UPI001C5F672D